MIPGARKWLGRAADDWRLQRGERRLWAGASSVGDLRELMARFCEGDLQEWPGHGGPRDPETLEIAPALAAANRQGFLTTCSQPGCTDYDSEGWDQRAAVDGLATPEVVERLRGLVAGTRLQMQVHTLRKSRIDYSTAVTCTRQGERSHTSFGARLTEGQIAFEFSGVRGDVIDQLAAMKQVTIIDPEWGDHDLLWRRLAEPDWDRPTPLASSPHRTAPRGTSPTPATQTSGASMSSIEEVRAGIAMANDQSAQSLGALQQAYSLVERAMSALQHATDGSGQADVSEANALLARAVSEIMEVQQAVQAAIQAAESVAARL